MNGVRLLLIALTIIAVAVAALSIAVTVVASETPMEHSQYVRMCTARNGLWFAFWALQPVLVWFILKSVWSYRSLLQILVSFVGSALCSLAGGLILFTLAEHAWFAIAAKFK